MRLKSSYEEEIEEFIKNIPREKFEAEGTSPEEVLSDENLMIRMGARLQKNEIEYHMDHDEAIDEVMMDCLGIDTEEVPEEPEEETSNRLIVKTALGLLIAEPSMDPYHPGIILEFQPDGADTAVDLAYAEVKQDEEPEDEKDAVHVYTYEDVTTEEWTRKYRIGKEETLRALKESDTYVECLVN